MNNTLLRTIPDVPLAIIGDIHGEIDALHALLDQLASRFSPRRKLVFIGDLCDRGPDSVGVIEHVQKLIQNDQAWAILGNHEINLLANDAKDGSGWYFDERDAADQPFYAPYTRATPFQRRAIRNFFAELPLALQSPTLRIVHATWDSPSIRQIADIKQNDLLQAMAHWKEEIESTAAQSGLHERYQEEKRRWAKELEDPDHPPPYLHGVADYEALEQVINPIKRLTSGVEARSAQPFYSGNRWRYSDRTAWWNEYTEDIPVVIGHYWRMFDLPSQTKASRYSMLFNGVSPTAWHGRKSRVFCVDYSAGARWRERKSQSVAGQTRFRLAALCWPERTLMFDNGDYYLTEDMP